MAELTVTSTADSGEGTLRAAISAAQDGDVILFDPIVFPPGQTTSILLSSYLVITKNVSIYGGVPDGQGGYTSGATKRYYVYRDVEGTRTKVYLDDEHPAMEDETVLFDLVCRVALDGQGVTRIFVFGSTSYPNPIVTLTGASFVSGDGSVVGGAIYAGNSSQVTFRECSISSSGRNGGGFNVEKTSVVVLYDSVVSNCAAMNGGGFSCSGTSSTTLNDCIIAGCSATSTGAGIYCVESSSITLNRCAIINCSATNGAAVYSLGDGARDFNDCVFENCSATTAAGVIYTRYTTRNTFDGCSFIGCSATANGGVLYAMEESQNEFVGCRFTSCSANYGGVARADTFSRNSFVACSFTSCNSAVSGGVCQAVNHSQNSFDDCAFEECSATGSGGAFILEAVSQNAFNSCRFTLCTGSAGGAVRCNADTQNAFHDCRFESCSANNGGGAVYVASNAQNEFHGCRFERCSSSSGGAIRNMGNAFNSFDGCAFEECSATSSGGAIYSQSNARNTFETPCVFKDCDAQYGSGVYDNTLQWSNVETSTFENCGYAAASLPSQQTVRYFTSTADSGDGSLRATITAARNNDIIQPDPTVFTNGAIININLSSAIVVDKRLYLRGAGRRIVLDGQGASRVLTLNASTATLVASDVDIVNGNDVGSNGAAIYISGSGGLTFVRSNIAGNYGVKLFHATDTAGTRLVSCFVQNNVGTSSLVNAYYVAYNTTIAGNYVGGVAKEFPATSTRTVNSINGNVYSNVGFVSAPPDSLAEANWNKDLWKSWNLSLTDESDYANGAEELNEIDALIAGDDADYDYEGFPRKPYKTTEQLGGALGAFEMRGNAKLVLNANDSGAGSLRQTITSAQDGDAILFSYAFFPKNETTAILLSSTLSVAKTVEIDGDGRVALDGQNSIRVCAMGDTDKSPHVKGLSIRDGAYANGAGLVLRGGASTVTNCIIEDCSATSACGGVYGTGNAVATLNNCIIRNNTAGTSGGGVYANNTSNLTLNDCAITNNSANTTGGGVNVSSTGTATFNNCVITNNSTNANGGALFTNGGTVVFNNTTATGNTTASTDQTLVGVVINAGTVTLNDSILEVLRTYSGVSVNVSGGVSTVGNLRLIARDDVLATVTIADGAALTITDAATIPTGSTFTSPGIGMIGKGSGVDLSSATLTNILVCEIGAGVVSVSGTKIGDCYTINIVSTDNTKSVLIEYKKEGDSSWTIAENVFIGASYSASIDGDCSFRVFDGATFQSVAIKVYGVYHEMAANVTVGYVKATGTVGYVKATGKVGAIKATGRVGYLQ